VALEDRLPVNHFPVAMLLSVELSRCVTVFMIVPVLLIKCQVIVVDGLCLF